MPNLRRLGLPASALALVGFSQGTMMALHVGLRRAVPPAAIVGYSGLLVLPPDGNLENSPPKSARGRRCCWFTANRTISFRRRLCFRRRRGSRRSACRCNGTCPPVSATASTRKGSATAANSWPASFRRASADPRSPVCLNPRDGLHNPVTPAYKLGPDAAVRHVSRDRNVVLNAHVSPSGFPALVLNADFRPLSYYPLSLWSWQDAIKAVFLERVNIVANYDRAVRSPSFEMKLPSVVSLKTFVKPSTHPAFTRFNVFLRDRFSCQYCGARDDLTFDHLLPRSRGGHTTWDNVVAACSPCNLRKGNLTPDESKMWPSQRPFQPSVQHLHRNGRLFPPNYLHDSWLDYLYWDTELDP